LERAILTTKQKALRVNLDHTIYGTFAEIGAGQEVVRHFFRAGGASGTIAKAMSAYDKDFSDAIYGPEVNNRYVCRSRVEKMIEQEYNLINERISREKRPDTKYFAFSNTITTIDYKKKYKGHGWVGIRFQTAPDKEPNEVILHIHPLENEAGLQQETIGILGVNLIYASFFYNDDPDVFLDSLYDGISLDKLQLDTIIMRGPEFEKVDNRLMSLKLVKNGMTNAVIFSPDGIMQHPADLLYKKNILTIRGSFRPVTKVNMDMILKGYEEFIKDKKVDKEKLQVLFEITLNNLLMEGDVDEHDFLDRADILCSLGQTVMISNYKKYYKLSEYLSSFTKKRLGFIPFKDKEKNVLHTSSNLDVHPRVQPLYDYLTFNKRVIDLKCNEDVLGIFSTKVLKMIKSGQSGWEEMVPTYVDMIIKKNKLFGYKESKEEAVPSDE